MIDIQLDKNLIDTAVIHSKERMQYEYNRFGLNQQSRFDMVLIGTIGQLAFKKYLNLKGIDFTFEFQAGQFDFAINTEIIEIKTSGYKISFSNLNMLYNCEQYERGLIKSYKYCVQMFINGYDRKNRVFNPKNCDKATIAGIILYENVRNYPIRNMNYADCFVIPLHDFIPIEEVFG